MRRLTLRIPQYPGPLPPAWHSALRPERLILVYLAVLLGFILYYQLSLPIFLSDTDTWFHLAGGRYFWAHGHPADSSFFSFIRPEKHLTNYYWGFQAVIFKVFAWDSYQGLIYFRALIHLATSLILALILFDDPRLRKSPLFPLIVLALALLLLHGRQTWVRPQIVSYLIIAAFIYVLECRRKLAPLLPILAIVWVNAHGKEWVVGALLCGAYLLEHLYASRKSAAQASPVSKTYLVSLLACSAALLVNPHGLGLVPLPFQTEQDLYRIISELRGLSINSFSSVTLSVKQISSFTSMWLLAAIEAVALVYLAVRRKLRLSHVILAAGGLYLLTDASRFTAEWILLTLPLIRELLLTRRISPARPSSYRWVVSAALAAYFAAMPFATLYPSISAYSHYPFDSDGLPVGTTRFLKQADAKGNFLAPPNQGGYSLWELYPKIRIFADMQFPPFSARDMFLANASTWSAEVLGHLMEEYKIDFIAVPLAREGFADIAKKFPALTPVFFDDAQVLYANKGLQPELVTKSALKYIDPYNLVKGTGTVEQRLSELERVEKVYPQGRRVNHAITWLLFEKKEYEKSLKSAYRMTEYHPLDPNSEYWIGNDLENLGRCTEAKQHFLASLAISSGDFATVLHRHLGTCAYLTKDFQAAVEHFDQSIDPYGRPEAPEDLYDYAFSAVVTGERDKAERLLDLMLLSAPPDKKSLIEEASSLKDRISRKDFESLGLMSWIRSLLD